MINNNIKKLVIMSLMTTAVFGSLINAENALAAEVVSSQILPAGSSIPVNETASVQVVKFDMKTNSSMQTYNFSMSLKINGAIKPGETLKIGVTNEGKEHTDITFRPSNGLDVQINGVVVGTFKTNGVLVFNDNISKFENPTINYSSGEYIQLGGINPIVRGTEMFVDQTLVINDVEAAKARFSLVVDRDPFGLTTNLYNRFLRKEGDIETVLLSNNQVGLGIEKALGSIPTKFTLVIDKNHNKDYYQMIQSSPTLNALISGSELTPYNSDNNTSIPNSSVSSTSPLTLVSEDESKIVYEFELTQQQINDLKIPMSEKYSGTYITISGLPSLLIKDSSGIKFDTPENGGNRWEGTYTMTLYAGDKAVTTNNDLVADSIYRSNNSYYGSVEDINADGDLANRTYDDKKIENIPFETIYRSNPALPEGETKVVQEGVVGKREITYSVVFNPNTKTEVSRTETSNKITVPKKDKIIEVGTKVPVAYEGDPNVDVNTSVKIIPGTPAEVDPKTGKIIKPGVPEKHIVGTKEIVTKQIPYSTTRTLDPNMVPGSPDKVITKGVNGKTTTTRIYSIDPKTGQLLPNPKESTQTVAAVNELIHYSPEEIPFKTFVKDNPELDEGERRVVQEGKPGLKDPEKNTVITQEIDEIIEVGTGIRETVSNKTQEETPFETIIKENPNIPVGEERVVQEGIPGVKEITTEQEMFNGEPVGEPNITEVILVEKIDKIIEVGTGVNDQVVVIDTIEIPFETIVKENPDMPVGQTKIIQDGVVGVIETTKTQETFNGEPVGNPIVEEKEITKKQDKIIEIGVGISDIVEEKDSKEIPFETITNENPELPIGEVRVIQEGVVGIIEIHTIQETFNGKPVGEPKTTEKITREKIDKIIEVGTLIVSETPDEPVEDVSSKEEKVEIPFESEIRENPELPEGEKRVVQEGVVGEKTITTTQKTLDGQPVGEPEVSESITKEPIKEIIEVGVGVRDKDESKENKDIPFETEIRNNPNLPEGEEKIIQEGVPGVIVITTIQETFNGKPVGQPVVKEELIKEPVKKIVEVGTKAPETTTQEPETTTTTEQPTITTQEPTTTIQTQEQTQAQHPDVKPDVKTGVEGVATNTTLLTSLGLGITGLLSALGYKKYNKNNKNKK